MNVLSCFSIKGGVGKTTTAVNLAFSSAADGARTLVWDLDPQGASSFYFRIRPRVKRGAKRLLGDKAVADKAIKGTDFEGLDLLPADLSYRELDLLFDRKKRRDQRLEKFLRDFSEEYDTVILDCPPGISLLQENVIRASDALVVPVIPTALSLRTLDQLLRFLRNSHVDGCNVLAFFSMVDRRRRLHREVVTRLLEASEDLSRLARSPEGLFAHNGSQVARPIKNSGSTLLSLLETTIPYASDIERMSVKRGPIWAVAPRGRSADAFSALWREISDHVEAKQ